MIYTTEQRRAKLAELIAWDTDARNMEREFWEEKKKYNRFVDRLPLFLRNRLYGYPTMCYLYHQRVITLMLEHFRFPEETWNQ